MPVITKPIQLTPVDIFRVIAQLTSDELAELRTLLSSSMHDEMLEQALMDMEDLQDARAVLAEYNPDEAIDYDEYTRRRFSAPTVQS